MRKKNFAYNLGHLNFAPNVISENLLSEKVIHIEKILFNKICWFILIDQNQKKTALFIQTDAFFWLGYYCRPGGHNFRRAVHFILLLWSNYHILCTWIELFYTWIAKSVKRVSIRESTMNPNPITPYLLEPNKRTQSSKNINKRCTPEHELL